MDMYVETAQNFGLGRFFRNVLKMGEKR